MNFYKRHIGDYLKDTAHLSLLEHGVYGRLLDVYYTRESGIPDAQAARLIGARGKEEAAALKVVLDEFFELVDGTWIQDRCEREIHAAGPVSDDSEGAPAKSGKARRQQEYRERRGAMFEALRERGITMPFKATMNELQDALLSVTKPSRVMVDVTGDDGSVTERVTDDGHNVTATNSHKPESSSQTPDVNPLGSAHANDTPSRACLRPAEITTAMRRHSIDAQPGDPRVQAAIDKGVTLETIEAACVSAKEKKKGQRVHAAYVLSIAEAWTREAAEPTDSVARSAKVHHAFPRDQRDASRSRAAYELTNVTVSTPHDSDEHEVIDVDAKRIG